MRGTYPRSRGSRNNRVTLIVIVAVCIIAAIAGYAVFGHKSGAPVADPGTSTTAQPIATSPQYHELPTSTPIPTSGSPTVQPSTPAPTTHPSQTPGGLQLTLAQLAGQRVIYSYAGLTPPPALLTLIRHGEAAGVIFFGQNISSTSQIAGVVKELEQANNSPDNPIRAPLLLMTDQEGGLVRRLPGGPDLSEKQIGASADPSQAASQAGSQAAATLLGVGMNVDLAPVLDVYRTAGNFDDQYGRSYSSDPSVAGSAGAAFITALQGQKVAATAKHFPGLGTAATSQDTDNVPVTLNVSLSDLRSIDEAPYKPALQAGVKLVMVSWATYPAISNKPAGLSSQIVNGELRNRLGFSGVTITDALEAGALKAYGSMGNRAELAAGAGMDLILCSAQDYTQGAQAAATLATAYQSGALNQSAFVAAVSRIIHLRDSLPA